MDQLETPLNELGKQKFQKSPLNGRNDSALLIPFSCANSWKVGISSGNQALTRWAFVATNPDPQADKFWVGHVTMAATTTKRAAIKGRCSARGE